MGSKTAIRAWHAFKEAGRPWPQLDEDDVIDFMIMEAVAVAASKQTQEQEKSSERKSWKQDREGLDRLRNVSAS